MYRTYRNTSLGANQKIKGRFAMWDFLFGQDIRIISERSLSNSVSSLFQASRLCTNSTSNLHDCRFTCSIRLRTRRGVQCSLRFHPRSILLDHSTHVRVWFTTARAPRSEEALRKRQSLGIVLRIFKTDKYPYTLSSPAVCQDAHNREEDHILGISLVRF